MSCLTWTNFFKICLFFQDLSRFFSDRLFAVRKTNCKITWKIIVPLYYRHSWPGRSLHEGSHDWFLYVLYSACQVQQVHTGACDAVQVLVQLYQYLVLPLPGRTSTCSSTVTLPQAGGTWYIGPIYCTLVVGFKTQMVVLLTTVPVPGTLPVLADARQGHYYWEHWWPQLLSLSHLYKLQVLGFFVVETF